MRDGRAELVRINSRGEAHPVGTVASQRLRQRQGAYRLLPAPRHLVLMRLAGEAGVLDAADGAVVRLCGEVTGAGVLPEIFGLVVQTGWKGELVVLDGINERSVFLDQGNVVGVETTVQAERLGSIMYRFGGVNERQLSQLTKEGTGSEKIGRRAIELGIADQGQVFNYLRRQVSEVVYSTLITSDGTYFFLAGFDEARLASKQVQSGNALLMDCVTRLDEIRFFREKIPSDQYVPQRIVGECEVQEEFRTTYDHVNGDSSIEAIGRATGAGEFGTTRAVYALLRAGVLTLSPPHIGQGLDAIVGFANEALRRLHRTADAAGCGDAVRRGLTSFASGAGVFDVLFREAGPHSDGTFSVANVVQNTQLMSQSDAEHTLRQMLHEYVGFALFSTGDALDADGERQLKEGVGPLVDRLQPPG